jgi:hypothetical protein
MKRQAYSPPGMRPPARECHDGQRSAVEVVGVEDDEIAPIQLAVIAQRE